MTHKVATVQCGRDRRTERTGIYHEVRMFLYDMGVAGVSFKLQGTGEVLVRPCERVGAAPHCSFSCGGNNYPRSEVARGRKSQVRPVAVGLDPLIASRHSDYASGAFSPSSEPSSWLGKP